MRVPENFFDSEQLLSWSYGIVTLKVCSRALLPDEYYSNKLLNIHQLVERQLKKRNKSDLFDVFQINSSLAFFLFSYQVHEKSILLAAL
jgi:ALG6, ALG8 glycosyltransferase family